MAVAPYKIHDGEMYYPMSTAAKLAHTTQKKLRGIILIEHIEYRNFRLNGRIYLRAEDFDRYLKKRAK